MTVGFLAGHFVVSTGSARMFSTSIAPMPHYFYCPDAALVVELDGDSHAQDGAAEADQERTAYLEAMGLKVIRFWNLQVHENEDWVLGTIREMCEERATDAPSRRTDAPE